MKTPFTLYRTLAMAGLFMLSMQTLNAQSYLVGPASPAVGTSANYTTHNHFNLFNVLNATGIYLDSLTIYPSTASTSYTIVVQNSALAQIASFTGVSTVGGNLPERIKVNLFIPAGTGYRLGLTTSSVGMLRNENGITFPYTVPNVISFTGATYGTTYWYFFYNIRVNLPITATDAGIISIMTPFDSVCEGSQPVMAVLRNYGPATLTATQIKWSVNQVDQQTFNWTGSLPLLDSVIVTIGNYNFVTPNSYAIKAYTFEPNNVQDTINVNDTAEVSGIIVKPAPGATLITANTSICQGDTIEIEGTLTGIPPWSIVINDGTTNFTLPNLTTANFSISFVPTSTKTYTLVSVTDAGGCTTLPALSATITVNPAPPASINPTTPPAFCAGDSVVLMGSIGAGFTYAWLKDGVTIPGAAGFTLIVKQAGAYQVKVTSPTGCSSLSAPQTVTVHPLPVVNLGNDTALLPNQAILLNAGAGFNTYQWSNNASSQTITVDTNGYGLGIRTIWVRVTDQNTCPGSDTININFIQNPGIAEEIHSPWIGISPNPSSGKITFQLINFQQGEVALEIFSQDGMLISRHTAMVNNPDQTAILDLHHLPNGLYLVKVNGANGVVTRKFIMNK